MKAADKSHKIDWYEISQVNRYKGEGSGEKQQLKMLGDTIKEDKEEMLSSVSLLPKELNEAPELLTALCFREQGPR